METLPFIIALILMFVGLAGIIIPFLPDMILIFLGALVYGIWTGFEKVTVGLVLIFLALAVLSFLFDWLGMILGAKKTKATNWGILGAILGSIVGIFVGGILGMILLALVGTIAFELIFAKKSFADSAKAGVGSVFGIIFAVIFKLVLAGIMIGLFLFKVF